ncbi:alanine racemase, partial [Streptomyces scabiei]|uniref:alanine racemase n=1 Tax=Streptomyces scabiei TaxID=1930 RepID=UPI0038F7557D
EELKQKGYDGKYPIHIKLETGMHRLGFKDNEIDELINKLKTYPVKVNSIFSHLSTADIPEEREYALKQIHVFDRNSTQLIIGLGY